MSVSLASKSLFEGWEEKHSALFDEQTIHVRHRLAETGLFTEDAIADLIDRADRQHLLITTMGFDKNVKEWRSGEVGNCSGHEVIEAIKNGRMWMNIFKLREIDARYGKVLDDIMNEFEARVPGLEVSKTGFTMLVSSPKIQVYYHADIQGQSLWQIAGKKRVYVYPASQTFVSDESIEKILMRETEEEVPYKSWFDDYAEVYDLEAGEMLHWPLYGPHRVENFDCLNISVTTEHYTREISNAFAVRYGNGVLRRTFGMDNLSTVPGGFHVLPKKAAAFLWSRLGIAKKNEFKLDTDFVVDPKAPNGLVDKYPTKSKDAA